MATTTQRKKLSKAAWFLIFLFIAAIITVAVLAFIGSISLQFVADGLTSYMAAGASDWVLATLLITLPFLGGILFYYVVKTYFIGDKTKGAIAQPGYSPIPSYPSATQKDTETVIS